ncbi:MAG TPA: hypothetical protein VMV10_12740 [Pirellulales bacterium]|nr:hypothetical protein [Pirellulales bacterium]
MKVRQTHFALVIAISIAAACWALPGCVGLSRPVSTLPTKHTLVIDPLIVYSDFSLPPHHRLLDDLVAERGELLAKLDLPKTEEPVHIYLFESEDRFHEFIGKHFPDFPVRRAFFVETDTRLTVYAHWGDRVAEDLRHEVSHGYLHAVVPNLPLWLDEGLAENAEVPRGEGGLNRPHVELLLENLENYGWRPNLERLERIDSAAEMTQIDYAEAWAWMHLLMETDPARRRLVHDYLSELRKGGPPPLFAPRVKGWFPQADELLIAHLRSLAATR